MIFLLDIIGVFLLLCIHSKIVDERLNLKKVVVSIILYYLSTLLFIVVFESTAFYSFGSLLIYPTFFILYTLSIGKLRNKVSLLLFYSLFPLGFWDVIKNFLGFFVIYNIPILNRLYETNLGIMIFSLLAEIIVFFLISLFQYNFSHLKIKNLDRKTKFILITADILMLTYFILPPYMNYIDKISQDRMLDYKELLTAVYFLLFICFINLLDRKLLQELQEQVVLQKEIQLQNLSNYSQQVEGLYQEIRSFRHDYVNILSSLKIGIDQKDINLVSQIYDSVLKNSGEKLKGKRFDVAQLRNINDLALKSLLLSKLSEAQNLSVPVSLEISEQFSIKNMEQIDFLTITSILLDNAIESAAEGGIAVCFLEDREWNKLVMIVKNSTLERKIELRDIFKRDNSSKGVGRGIGLANVRRILKSYPNVCLKTTSKNYVFTQILEIEL
ncbi:GHKL domain-containing protein [Streptococcus pseudopneumoniae]|uniref:Two-component system, AgrA family, sensor histidine kinase AgrC n=1 Tax=Streptococcus pseudopneumoniae TaxID=257758 RepID=A0A0T8UE96_9STRE|nr:GHKL domain-containing protein [Streptococcus pseudopneumoniae]CKB16553.1 two-component system%2C AgrA family%2C sensor histidine kinase AgrC [Streptococcus pseudopneumoniae]